jgi:hypothetical protein
MIATVGVLSLADIVPLLATFKLAVDSSTAIAIPDVQARIAGLNGVLGALTFAPPDLAGTIDAAIQTVTQLQAAIGGPTVTLEIPAITAQLDALVVQLGTLTAAAALTIPAGMLSAYVYDGPSGAIGAEVQGAINASLPGAPGHANALILVTTSPADWAAADEVFLP